MVESSATSSAGYKKKPVNPLSSCTYGCQNVNGKCEFFFLFVNFAFLLSLHSDLNVLLFCYDSRLPSDTYLYVALYKIIQYFNTLYT